MDDHAPFLNYGVPVVHIIDNPFPSVWHTNKDDISHLNLDTIYDISTIIRVFIVEIFQLL